MIGFSLSSDPCISESDAKSVEDSSLISTLLPVETGKITYIPGEASIADTSYPEAVGDDRALAGQDDSADVEQYVRLDMNGVVPEPAYDGVAYIDSYRLLHLPDTIPTAAGYIFEGWFLKDSSVEVHDGDYMAWSDDGYQEIVLYAHWNYLGPWQISYSHGDDNELAHLIDESGYDLRYCYDVWETFVVPDLKSTDPTMIFLGWTSELNDVPAFNVRVPAGTAGDLHFCSHWDGPYVPITYYGVEDADNRGNPSSFNKGGPSITLVDPSREGYTFLGWSCTDKYVEPGPVKGLVISDVYGDELFVTANWAVNTYNITYIGIEDALDCGNPSTYTIEDTFPLNNPTRIGCTFLGWTDGSTSAPSTDVWIKRGTAGNLTFYASWDLMEYSIRYGGVEGADNSANPLSYSVDDSFSLAQPVKDGFVFVGWVGKGYSTPTQSPVVEKGTVGDLFFSAIWSKIGYGITYEGVDGAVNINPATYSNAQGLTLNDPVKKGYEFLGWTGDGITEPVKGLEIAKGTEGDLTFTANWAVITYTITYNGTEGADNMGNPTSYTVEDHVYVLDPVKPDCAFTGWRIGDSGPLVFSVSFKAGTVGDIVLTANWEFTSTDILLDFNGKTASFSGSVSRSADMTVHFSGAAPTANGYTFLGWYTEPEGGQKVSDGDRLDTDVLYAHWEPTVYSITYAGLEGAVSPENPTSYTVEDRFTLDNPWKTGSVFAGWEDGRDGNILLTVSVVPGTTGDLVFTACFETIRYPVVYKGVIGADNSGNPGYYTIEQSFDLKAPVREGYEFLGWGGSGLTELTKDVHVDAGTTGKLVYTAYWKMIVYSITYEGVEGAVNDNPDHYGIRDLPLALSQPEKAGFEFLGWQSDSGLQKEPVIPEGTAGDLTFTAVWDEMLFDVTVTAEGGKLSVNGVQSGSQSVRAYPFGTSVSVDGDKLTVGSDVYTASSEEHDTVSWSVEDNVTEVLRDIGIQALFSDSQDQVKEIAVFQMPYKTEYSIGEEFDPAGMVLSVMYRSGTVLKVSSGYTCTPTVLDSLDITAVTVDYQGFKTECPVTVSDAVEYIEITSAPNKLVYAVGDEFDPSGMKVMAKYLSGAQAEVFGYTYFPVMLDQVGRQNVEVSYRGFSDVQEIAVLPTVEPDFAKGKVLIHADDSGQISGAEFKKAMRSIAEQAVQYGPSVDVIIESGSNGAVYVPSGILYAVKSAGMDLHIVVSAGSVTLSAEALYTEDLKGSDLEVLLRQLRTGDGDGSVAMELAFQTAHGVFDGSFDAPLKVCVPYDGDSAPRVLFYDGDGGMVYGPAETDTILGREIASFEVESASEFLIGPAGTQYGIDVKTYGDGSAEVSPNPAEEHVVVTVRITPGVGSAIDSVIMNGRIIEVSDGVCTFQMPASDVTLEVVFAGPAEESSDSSVLIAAVLAVVVLAAVAVVLLRRRA